MKKTVLITAGLAVFTIAMVLAQTKNPPAQAKPKTTTAATPAKKAPVKAAAAPGGSLKASVAEGQKIYTQFCVSCHQVDGGGVENMTPPLLKTKYVLGDKVKLAGIVIKGLSNVEIEGETYHNVMPPLDYLTNKQIADVLTYVRNSFGNKATAVTEKDVQAARGK